MTEHTDTPPADKPKDDPEPGGDDIAAVRREAAGYRTKLRETEAERDKLTERLGNFQRAEAERLAATAADGFKPLADGSDLWHEGTELEALVADDGTLNVEAVRERVSAPGEKRPHYLVQPKGPSGGADQRRGAGPKEDDKLSFGEALKSA
jgi:hypothetical protein